MQDVQTLNSKSAAFVTDYQINSDGRVSSLYELAKEKAWNARKDLDWNFPEHSVPQGPGDIPLSNFPPYMSLSSIERTQVDRKWHAIEISEILHGEQGALLISSQLVQLLTSMEAKLFASSQVFDEARHVEFFSTYLQSHVGEIRAPSDELRGLIEDALSHASIDVKLIAMQIVIESLAMAKFQRLKGSTASPILRVALEYILKDEARHVSFGVELLRDRIEKMDIVTRNAHAKFALEAVLRLGGSLNAPVKIAQEVGWDQAELRRHLRERRILDPSEAQAVFRQLRMSLKAVSLLTNEIEEKLTALGL